MGFDMHTIQAADDTEKDAVRVANEAFDAAVAKRGEHKFGTAGYVAAQAVVEETCDAIDTARTSYFRLNNRGMGYCHELMEKYGMVYDPPREGAWPAYPNIPEDATDEEEEAMDQQYREAAKPFLSQHPEGGEVIPSLKFSSNDGWIVTPEECRATVAAWRAKGSPTPHYNDEPLRWWGEWIAFLEHSADRGGFTVN